jgi:hypothetical protein
VKAIFGAALGFRPVELLDLIGGERVLASHRVTVELLHTLLVGRLDTRGSAFGGGTSLHSGGVSLRSTTLGCGTRPMLGNGSPLLGRSPLRRSSSFWSRSFFRLDRALAVRRLRLAIYCLLQSHALINEMLVDKVE